MLQEQIIAELNQIPSDKLAEVYDFIHYFRLGLMHEQALQANPSQTGFAKRWQGQFTIDGTTGDDRLDYLKQRYQL